VGRLVRKNLMVDPETLGDLARRRGTSESEAVREAVSNALAAGEMVAALEGLRDAGAFADFEQLFGDPAVDSAEPPVGRREVRSTARR
jgi:hypothetical protein